MDTRPVSGLLGAAAYRPFLPGNGSALVRHPPPAAAEPVDVVELSPEARDLARQFAQPFPRDAYWDQVRYDPPHTDDPDFPWEVAHKEWMQLVDRVFRRDDPGGRPGQPGEGPSSPSPRS